MRGKLIWTLSLFFFALQFVFAQEKTITGMVKDESGQPLLGVTVTIKGTTRGVATDFDGNYSIKAKAGEVLHFVALGMKPIDRPVSASTTKIDVIMEEEAEQLEEVVVMGYSSVKKSEFVGTAAQVNMGSVEAKSVASVAQALKGEIAGVRVITTTGQPGAAPTIRIRGFGSVNGSRDPLFVVDGVPFSGSIASINPDDIESTTVLKDAAATAIYGARGANGVVVINTKTGKTNNDYIQIESKVGFNTQYLPRYDVVRSPEEYLELSWRALYNRGSLTKGVTDPVAYANNQLFYTQGGNEGHGISSRYNIWNGDWRNYIDPATGKMRSDVTRKYTPENWLNHTFRPAVRSEHNISLGGGAGKTTYYASLGHLKDGGYSINSEYERFSGRLNLNYAPKSWLLGGFNLGYSHSKVKNAGQASNSDSVFWYADNIPSIYPLFLRDAEGNFVADPYYGGHQYDFGEGRRFSGLTNPVAVATLDKLKNYRHETNANFFIKANILRGLSFESRLGGQLYNRTSTSLVNPYYGSAASDRGTISKSKDEALNWNFLQLLRYSTKFGNDHHLETFVAHESTNYEYNYLSAFKKGLANPDIAEIANAITMGSMDSYTEGYSLESYFGQLNYDFRGKYFVSASIRRDGSSRFLKNKWDTFPSLGLSWVISKESFMNNIKWVDSLKLKGSYGIIGDQAGVGYYPGYNVYDLSNLNGQIATPFNRSGYPDLTWEKSKMFQVGTDFELFDRRLEGSIDYYVKSVENLIFDKRLAPSTGNAIYKDNDGILENKGLEFNFTGHIVRTKNVYLNLSLNGEIISNKLTKMPFDQSIKSPKIIDIAGNFGRSQGHSLYDFYMREWAGVNPDTGVAQWVRHFDDKNGNKTFDSGEEIGSLHDYQHKNPNAAILQDITTNYSQATQKYIGKSIVPDVRGAFGFNFGYKGLSLSTQFLYSIGGYAYDGAYAGLMGNEQVGANNWHKDMHNSWKKRGDITDVPRMSSAHSTDTNFNSTSSRFLTKADYLALNNISLGYSLPEDFLRGTGFKAVSFSLSGDNLWLSSDRIGFNPTVSETGSTSTYTYSPLTTFTMGVKVKF